MTSVLCASGGHKGSGRRGRDDLDDDLDDEEAEEERARRRPLSPPNRRQPTNEDSGSLSLGSPVTGASTTAPPTATTSQPAFSRVEKLHTVLRLPDGREFSLPVCVDLALNLLLNSFDR